MSKSNDEMKHFTKAMLMIAIVAGLLMPRINENDIITLEKEVSNVIV